MGDTSQPAGGTPRGKGKGGARGPRGTGRGRKDAPPDGQLPPGLNAIPQSPRAPPPPPPQQPPTSHPPGQSPPGQQQPQPCQLRQQQPPQQQQPQQQQPTTTTTHHHQQQRRRHHQQPRQSKQPPAPEEQHNPHPRQQEPQQRRQPSNRGRQPTPTPTPLPTPPQAVTASQPPEAQSQAAESTGPAVAVAVVEAELEADEWTGVRSLYPRGATAEALGGTSLSADELSCNQEAQAEEKMALEAIYGEELRVVVPPSGSTAVHPELSNEVLELRITLELPVPVVLELPPSLDDVARGCGLRPDEYGTERRVPLGSLPPLLLRFRFPPDYPSHAAPAYALRCSWLSDEQLERLVAALDRQWELSGGCGALVSVWAEWLRGSWVEELTEAVLQPLRLPEDDRDDNMRAACCLRAARWPRPAALVLRALVQHAEAAAEGEWRGALHTCGICFDTFVSADCLRFVRCSHTYCKACVGGYFESQLGDGAATALLCPEPSCRIAATPPEVKLVLAAGLYERYERQLLQASLDEMKDVVWCPRCQYPAMQDPEPARQGGVLATCGKCGFAFCSECRQSWHGLSPCANLAQRWRSADEAGREALRKKYGEKVMEEVQSSEWMVEHTKPCPNCSTKIQKNGGCNHITCRTCNHEWCWLCHAKYQVGHFKNGNCEQFSQDFFDEINLTREEFDQNYVVMNHW